MPDTQHRDVRHVMKRGDAWIVRGEGSIEPYSTHRTKEEAVRAAVDGAKKVQPSQVKIHKEDGQFEEERTFGNDPYPPKG